MALLPGGGHAELVAVHESHTLPVPEHVTWPEAGGFVEVFATAHDALFTQAELKPGERLLVNGAAGGVGVAAVQLGVALGAGHRLGAPSPERAGGARRRDEPSGVYDVILELVGGDNLAANLERLAPRGRIAVIGTGAGAAGEIDFGLLMGKRGRIHGSMLRSRSREEKADVIRRLRDDVLPLLANGRIRVPSRRRSRSSRRRTPTSGSPRAASSASSSSCRSAPLRSPHGCRCRSSGRWPRWLHRSDPRSPAGREGRVHREGARARRHVPARRVHPDQGLGADRALPAPGERHVREARREGRRAAARLRRRQRVEGRRRQADDRRRRRPAEGERRRVGEGLRQVHGREHDRDRGRGGRQPSSRRSSRRARSRCARRSRASNPTSVSTRPACSRRPRCRSGS